MKLSYSALIAVFLCCGPLFEGLHAASVQGLDSTLSNKLKQLDNSLKSLKDELEKELEQKKDESAAAATQQDESTNADEKRDDSSNSLSCNFEDYSSGCGLVFKAEDHKANKPKWELRRDYGFIKDPSAERGGYFYFADVKDNHPKNQFTTLAASFKVGGSSAKQCVQFSYLMYDHFRYCDAARFKLELVCGNERTQLFRTTNTPTYRWYKAQADINKAVGTECVLEFLVARGLGQSRGGIGLDDVKITFGQECTPPPASNPAAVHAPSDMSCNFEHFQDECLWQKRGQLDWAHANWGTRQSGTGPDNYFGRELYSTSGGAYRYIDSREDKNFEKRNKTAIFASPSLKASAQQQNMKFAYSMDGKDVGSLRVLFVDQSANKETVAFEKKGNQGKGPAWSWFDTCVDLPTSGTYKIMIEATAGNGFKSDIAVDSILVGEGGCAASKLLASCNFQDKCEYVTDEKCEQPGPKLAFEMKEEFKPSRGKLLGEIPRIAKEWSLSLDLKPGSEKRTDWSSILKFTVNNRECCYRGDRVPGFQFLPRTHQIEIASAIGWSGNWNDKSIALASGVYSSIRVEQKKETDGKYYFITYLNNQVKRRQHNAMPVEWRNVKIFASDPFLDSSDVYIKNVIFKNEGEYETCDSDCNKPLADPAFDGFFNPKESVVYENAAEVTPTKSNLVKEGFTVHKQFELSMEVKALGKTPGWTNIIHVNDGKKDCCDKGNRVPAIFLFSNSYKMHMTSALEWSGNYAYNNAQLVENKWVKIVVRQKKEDDGRYHYSIIIDDVVKFTKVHFLPLTFKDMKMYVGSPHYKAANVKIRNLVYKNLVSAEYQCPNMCKGLVGQETVSGKAVKTMTYTYETCQNREYELSLRPTGLEPFLRYGCLHISYKVSGKAWRGTLRCDFNIMANRHTLLRVQLKNDAEYNKWHTHSISVNKYWRRFNTPFIGVRGAYTRDHCPSLTFGEMRLEEGFCKDATV